MKSNNPSINFLKIVNTHLAVKNKLTDLLNINSNDEYHLDHTLKNGSCTFNILVQTNLNLFENLSAFEEVRILHSRFHGLADEIVRLHNDGQLENASALLHGRFQQVSRKLQSKLASLSHQYILSLYL